MRAVIVLLLVVVLAAAVGFALLSSSGALAPALPGSEPRVPVLSAPRAGAAPDAGPARNSLPPTVVATRAAAASIPPGELADRATVYLRVVDHDTDRAIVGAVVRRRLTGADLSVSGEQGLAPVPLKSAAQLAVVAPSYLLRLAPAQLGSTKLAPQTVRLVRDRWSLLRRFVFETTDGRSLDSVFVRLRPRVNPVGADGGSAMRSPGPQDDPILRRAWQEHTMLAATEASRDVAVQLGRYNQRLVHKLEDDGNGAIVRFLQPGVFDMEVATTAYAGRAPVVVAAGPEPPLQRILLSPGSYVSGRVQTRSGAALVDAEIRVQGEDPLGLLAKSSQDGSFELGPLLAGGTCTLLVRHGLHEPTTLGPLDTGSAGVSIRLDPLPGTLLRGRVRLRPDLEPLAGVKVVWQVAGGASVQVETGADGIFELMARGSVAARLRIQGAGAVPYSELVDPDAPLRDYDLLPADPKERVAAGLTAQLEGVAFGAEGGALSGQAVRWRPDVGAAGSPGQAGVSGGPIGLGRRILSGGSFEGVLVTTTDSSGAFRLETDRFGPGRLEFSDRPAVAVRVTATAGKNTTDIELRAK